MDAVCQACKKPVSNFNFEQAEVVTSSIDGHPVVDLILSCPHCGRKYNDFLFIEDLELLEV